MSTGYIDLIIAVLATFAMVLSATIAAGAAAVIIKLVTIPCVLLGTGFIIGLLFDYRNETGGE